MKLRLFGVGDAFVATQSHVCLNAETSRRLLLIEISSSVCVAFDSCSVLAAGHDLDYDTGIL